MHVHKRIGELANGLWLARLVRLRDLQGRRHGCNAGILPALFGALSSQSVGGVIANVGADGALAVVTDNLVATWGSLPLLPAGEHVGMFQLAVAQHNNGAKTPAAVELGVSHKRDGAVHLVFTFAGKYSAPRGVSSVFKLNSSQGT